MPIGPSFRRMLRSSQRAQTMVEFALVLPVLAMLLVLAIDVGRVFFGWVALQNAARIGADHAARYPLAWPPPGSNPFEQQALDLYVELITNDLQAINCDPDANSDGSVDIDDLPATFENADGTTTGDTKEDGDHAIVTLTCEFQLLTPLAEVILGGPMDIGAQAHFAINSSATLALPTPIPTPTPTPTPAPTPTPTPGGNPTPTPLVCPLPVANFTAVPTTGPRPLTVTFTDSSTATAGCPILAWSWNFDDGPPTNDSSQQNPVKQFTYNGNASSRNFNVVLTVTNSGGSDTHTVTITVTR